MSVRQYIGARYVTKIYENSLDPSSAEWEQGTFDPLVMVTWQNSTYLSKKQVPGSVGDPANNPDYWVVTGYYNGQIMQLQSDVASIINTIGDLLNLNTDDKSSVVNAVNETYNATMHIKGTSRHKLGWYSSNVLRAYGDTYSMNGFRFFGQFMKADNHIYTADSGHYDMGCLIGNLTNDIEVIDTPQASCWYGAFAVPTASDKCAMKFSPFLRVTGVSGDTYTVGSTEEGLISNTLSSNLEDLTGRDVLIITFNGGNLCGVVSKIVSNTTSTITIEDSININVNDYLLIAPADSYCYIASHYYDTSAWRNRQDNGEAVKMYGIAHPDALTPNTEYEFVNYNEVSPLASGVMFNVTFTAATTSQGYVYAKTGEALHLITEYEGYKAATSSYALISNVISCYYDYRQTFSIEPVVAAAISGATTCAMRVYGYYEM